MNKKTNDQLSATEELETMRHSIDAVDSELVKLLAKRCDLVAEVGAIKHRSGQSIYAPDREITLISERRAEAIEALSR